MAGVRSVILFVVLVLVTSLAEAQLRQPMQPSTIPFNYSARDFYVDNMGNLYVVTKTNQLIKYGEKGDSIGLFNDSRKYGALYSLDVTNPLKLLLFYKDFSTLLVLDRFLNARNTLDLRRLDIQQIKAYCLSYDNNIWVYDELTGRIRKIEEGGNQLSESSDLRVALGEAVSPERLIDSDNKLYMYDDESGFYIFDYFGTLQNKIPLLGWKDISVEQNVIYGVKGDAVSSYNIKTHIQNILEVPLGAGQMLKVIVKNSRMYALYNNKIVVTEVKTL